MGRVEDDLRWGLGFVCKLVDAVLTLDYKLKAVFQSDSF